MGTRSITVYFTEEEFQKLVKAKDAEEKSWHDYILDHAGI